MNELTDAIRQKYTSIKPCCVHDTPDAHTVWLNVGGQSFCVTSEALETEADAEAFRTMLAGALNTMVSELVEDPIYFQPRPNP